MRTTQKRNAHLGCVLAFGAMLGTASAAAADVVTDWNVLTVGFANAAGRPGPSSIVDVAMVHLAMHDAVQAYQQRFRTYGEPIQGASGSPVAAVATAAHDVLLSRYAPGQQAAIDNAYNNYLSSRGLTNDAGVTVGHNAATAVIAARANDGSFPAASESFIGGTAMGQWRPTPPLNQSMAAPWLGDVTPFALRDVVGLLHEPEPPALTSGLYARDYNEVKRMGARTGSDRTPAQTDLAYFYSGNFLTMMNGAARAVALARLTDIGDTARLLALANMSTADAIIVSWNAKRTYYFWRPLTAIFEGDFDGNPRTDGDTSWLPLIDNPPYPDYTSGANSFTNAFMRTLELFFGSDEWTFDVATTAAPAIQKTRTYHAFSSVADDVVDARVYLGIHFRFADVVARRQAKQSADWAFAHTLQAID